MPVHEDSKHTVDFIEKCHAEKKPFFVNLWIHEPHTPFHTVPKYRWRFRELEERDNIYASVLSHADDRIGEVLETLDRLKLKKHPLSSSAPTMVLRVPLVLPTHTHARYRYRSWLRDRGRQRITGGERDIDRLFEGGIGAFYCSLAG